MDFTVYCEKLPRESCVRNRTSKAAKALSIDASLQLFSIAPTRESNKRAVLRCKSLLLALSVTALRRMIMALLE
jgi:hypothetical protein